MTVIVTEQLIGRSLERRREVSAGLRTETRDSGRGGRMYLLMVSEFPQLIGP